MYEKYTKRIIDIIFAGLLLVLLLPFAVIIAIVIKVDSKGPVFFRQQRYGKHKKPFLIYKFRTMTVHAPSDTATSDFYDSHSYITGIGKILRKLSIDELPQFVNVLKGEMSIVGPRPVVLTETLLITERSRYHANACKPGITGWAQVNGRDELNARQKAKLDGYYAKHISFALDIKCLLKTVHVILSSSGHAEGHEQSRKKIIRELE